MSGGCLCAKSLLAAALKIPDHPWERLLALLPFTPPTAALSLQAAAGAGAGAAAGITASALIKLVANPPAVPLIAEARLQAMVKLAMAYKLILSAFKLDMTLAAHQEALFKAVATAELNAAALAPLRRMDLAALAQTAAWAMAVAALSKLLDKDLKSIRTDAQLQLAMQASASLSATGTVGLAFQAALSLPRAPLIQVSATCQLYAQLQLIADCFGESWGTVGCAARIAAKIQAMLSARISLRAAGAGLPIPEIVKLIAALAAAQAILEALGVDVLAPDGFQQLRVALSAYARLNVALSGGLKAGLNLGLALPTPALIALTKKITLEETARLGAIDSVSTRPLFDAALSLSAMISLSADLNVVAGGLLRAPGALCGGACPLLKL